MPARGSVAARDSALRSSPRSPARTELSPALPPLVQRVRAVSEVPVYAGFGISTPEHARAVADLADGVVVGSRAVETAEEGPEALRDYVASLRTALDS